jgi:hypothetical protein
MVNISSYTFPQMTDLIKRSFLYMQKTLPQVMRNSSFVVSDVIPHGTGDTRRYAQRIHRTQYAGIRDEGYSSRQAQIQYGYEKDLQVYTISLETSITKHMRDTGKNPEILAAITDLSEVCPNTIDLDFAHRLTFHTATSYTRTAGNTSTTVDLTMGDGLALASTVHKLSGSATTYNNIITGNPQFSKGALENAEKLFVEETYDNLGIKLNMVADTIVTTDDPNTINQVRELLHATANVDAAHAGTFNTYANKYKHVVVPRIATTGTGATDTTKRKYRFLVASRNSSFYFTVLNEPYTKAPADGNNGEEFSSENWNYLTAASYGIAIVSPEWIKCSTGL